MQERPASANNSFAKIGYHNDLTPFAWDRSQGYLGFVGSLRLTPSLPFLLTGGLAILSNYLQDKDRFTINNNYGEIKTPKMTYNHADSISPRQKLAALFAFKNKKYTMHHENTHEHVEAGKDVVQEIQQINDLINSMDFEELKDCVERYNVSQEEEKKSVDNHKNLRL